MLPHEVWGLYTMYVLQILHKFYAHTSLNCRVDVSLLHFFFLSTGILHMNTAIP